MRWGWSLLVAIDLITMVIAVLGAITAYRNWRLSHDEASRSFGGLVEIGEGRTSFLSLWGILTSAGFFVAVAFDFIGLWIVPLCG